VEVLWACKVKSKTRKCCRREREYDLLDVDVNEKAVDDDDERSTRLHPVRVHMIINKYQSFDPLLSKNSCESNVDDDLDQQYSKMTIFGAH
jgi:hypothetical protein